jgi:CxxC-x17-CxxC domain-containing protein
MADKNLKCSECGQPFVFTDGEQRSYAAQKYKDPTRCEACREKRRVARGLAPRPQHGAVCACCGTDTKVPFVPVVGWPVFCLHCYGG